MSTLQHILRKAQRRALIDHALHRVGWGLSAAIAFAIGLLVLDRLGGVPVPEMAYGILAAAGAVVGAAISLFTVPNRFDLAVKLDRALHLKDRIGTAATLEMAKSSITIDPEFAELVQRDASRLAETIDARAAVPIRFTRIWAAVVPMVALLATGVMFLPALNWGDSSTSPQIASQQTEQVRQQASQMAETIQQTVAELPRDQTIDERGRADLEALDRLAQQLSDKSAPVEELAKARDESAARLNELADRLARQSQRDLAAADEIAKRFAGLENTGAPQPPMSTREFTEALQRGDFGEATQQLETLLNDETLTSVERGEAAEHLRELAARLDDRTSDAAPATAERSAAPVPDHAPSAPNDNENREKLADALRDQGLDEQAIRETLDNPPPSEEQLQRDLQERNVDEDVARQLARDIQKHNERREIDDQTQKAVDEVKESLRDAAKELESTKPNQPDQQEPSRKDPLAPGSAGGSPETQRQPESQQRQQPASAERPAQPGTRPSPQPDPAQPSPQGQPQREAQQQVQQPQETPQSRPSTDSPSRPGARKEKPDEQSQQPQAAKEQLNDQNGEPQQRNGQQPDQSTSPTASDQESQPSPSETLRRMSERREDAEKGRQSAEQLRKLARQFMENTTPEQRRKLADQAEQLMRQQQAKQNQPDQSSPPTPDGESPPDAEELNQIAREMFDKMTPQERQEMAERLARLQREQLPRSTQGAGGDPRGERAGPDQPSPPQPSRLTGADDLDLRGKETADRIIAQWLDDQLESTPAGSGSASSSPTPIRNAQQIAERAVNETAVQKRYHRAIQRYFGRLNETVEKAAMEMPAKKE